MPASLKSQTKKVIALYKTRMQIEENFRDTNNAQLGLGLEYARSKSPERYDNLLLISASILFVLWCIGYAANELGYRNSLQAKVTTRHVLSVIYIGREVIDDERYKIDELSVIAVLNNCPSLRFR